MRFVVIRKNLSTDWAFVFLLGVLLSTQNLLFPMRTLPTGTLNNLWNFQTSGLNYHPVYDLFLYLTQLIVGNSSQALRLISSLLFSVSGIVFGSFLLRVGFSRFLAVTGALMYLVHPLQISLWKNFHELPHVLGFIWLTLAWLTLLEQRGSVLASSLVSLFFFFCAVGTSHISIAYIPVAVALLLWVRPSMLGGRLLSLIPAFILSALLAYALWIKSPAANSGAFYSFTDFVMYVSHHLQNALLPFWNHSLPSSIHSADFTWLFLCAVLTILSFLALILSWGKRSLFSVGCFTAIIVFALPALWKLPTSVYAPYVLLTSAFIMIVLDFIHKLPCLLNLKKVIAAIFVVGWFLTSWLTVSA